MPDKIDTSDPGKAAAVYFAAAWLFAQVSKMNAANKERDLNNYGPAYGDEAYAGAVEDAEMMASVVREEANHA